MTEMMTRPSAEHGKPSQRVSVSSGEVWAADFRPLVETEPEWLPSALARAASLYRHGRVDPAAHNTLLEVLRDSIWYGAPEPFVSGTEDRGVSAEFDTASIHLQVESAPDGTVYVYAAERGLSDWDGRVEDLPDGLAKWAWRLRMAYHDET